VGTGHHKPIQMKKQYRYTFQLNGAIHGNYKGEIYTMNGAITLQSIIPNTTINGLIDAKSHKEATEIFNQFKVINCIKGRLIRITMFTNRKYTMVVKKANVVNDIPEYDEFIRRPNMRKCDIHNWYEDEWNHPKDCQYFVVSIIDNKDEVVVMFERRKGNKMADKYIIGGANKFRSKH
jgi:hypothetical protein